MHDSSKCVVCGGRSVGQSMTDTEFFTFLAACRSELAEKQGRFQKLIVANAPWFYDMADCSLRIGNELFRMTPIGTFSAEHKSWLWAWANEQFPMIARERSKQIQRLYESTGFRVFLDPGIKASAKDAQDFTALSVHELEANGFFRTTSSEPIVYLAVHERMN